ncbi:MAG: bifunctional phosphoglucose/phosphomannose isomerase [candidate division Zixibacteria bacterium]|nr:bifunctional phosphoglucose/phosphomannose isomerase [Candidatus Tariuqbacter arcticus]
MKISPMYNYILGFTGQLKKGYRLVETPSLPNMTFDAVILCGMGGSAIGGDLLTGCAKPDIPIPFAINRSYRLPGWVNEKTLAIFSSYSGGTEETLSCFNEAQKKKIPSLAITSGGQLSRLCSETNIPTINIPGGLPPRAALGYSFAPLFSLFKRLELIKSSNDEFERAVELLEKLSVEYSQPAGEPANLAAEIQGKIPVFYADGFRLEAIISRFRCQLAENAKTLAFGNVFTELNHNEIVGWGIPPDTIDKFTAIFIWDPESDYRVTRQMQGTKEILSNLGLKVHHVQAQGETFLAKMLSLAHFADWLSYHLAVLNRVDPIPIERIDALKRKLKNSEKGS